MKRYTHKRNKDGMLLKKVAVSMFVPKSSIDTIMEITGMSEAKAFKFIVKEYKCNAMAYECDKMFLRSAGKNEYYLSNDDYYNGRLAEIEPPYWI